MMCFINFLGVKVQKIFGIDVIFLNFFCFSVFFVFSAVKIFN